MKFKDSENDKLIQRYQIQQLAKEEELASASNIPFESYSKIKHIDFFRDFSFSFSERIFSDNGLNEFGKKYLTGNSDEKLLCSYFLNTTQYSNINQILYQPLDPISFLKILKTLFETSSSFGKGLEYQEVVFEKAIFKIF